MADINTKKCNFCGKEYSEEELNEKGVVLYKSKAEVDGKRIRICSECLKLGYEKFEERKKNLVTAKEEEKKLEIDTPRDIKAYLDEWVIEQERPKITLATELYAHKKRIKRLEEDPEAGKTLRMDKSNIIFLGPTGSGKTESVRALCSCLDLPYTIQDISGYSSTGYVGLCR